MLPAGKGRRYIVVRMTWAKKKKKDEGKKKTLPKKAIDKTTRPDGDQGGPHTLHAVGDAVVLGSSLSTMDGQGGSFVAIRL